MDKQQDEEQKVDVSIDESFWILVIIGIFFAINIIYPY